MGSGWQDVEAFVGQRYPVTKRRSDAIAFGWPAARPRCEIRAKRIDIHGRDWLFLGVRICRDREAAPYDMLSMNANLAIGALSVCDGIVVFRATMRLARFADEELGETIEALGLGAHRLRERLCHRAGPVDLGSDYAD